MDSDAIVQICCKIYEFQHSDGTDGTEVTASNLIGKMKLGTWKLRKGLEQCFIVDSTNTIL